MFKSIRWKFIIVYFLLVFIAMAIVGVFIIRKFEEHQISQTTNSMEQQIEKLKISTIIQKDNWEEVKEDIQETIMGWPSPTTDRIYIISNSEDPSIIATNSSNISKIVGESAFENKNVDNELILSSLSGEKNSKVISTTDSNTKVKHLSYPVMGDYGQIKGIIYITSDLKNVSDTISESKVILIKATLLALFITVILGFLIARSVTEPIKDVTVKAEKMAEGDFNQYVEVKSDDEIGQLASMFNFLTKKLKDTISEVYREKSKMETTFTYMADGLVSISMDGDILHANPIALSILNIEERDIKNYKYDDIMMGLNEKITLDYVKEKNQWQGNAIISANSSIYRAKYAPFKNDKDEIGGLIVVFQDITEQHKLDNMRKEFVANVSHELKTPITTIKSYTETLIDGAIDNKEISIQFLNVVNDECDRMARIVRDLLQLSNLDYKQMKWKNVKTSVKNIIDSAYTKIKISAEEKGQTIKIHIPEDVHDVFVDKDGFEQVLLNIMSNAIKYTPDNGEIYVSARNEQDKIIISVKDDGIGIPTEDMNRIFERFYRVDKARSRDLGGTGLGLSIARQIVEAHGGQIWLESEMNMGTEVFIMIPSA